MYTAVSSQLFIHIIVHLRPAPLKPNEFNVLLIYKWAILGIKCISVYVIHTK